MFLLSVSEPEEHATKPRGNTPMRKISKPKLKVASSGATTFDNSFFSGKRTLRHPKLKAHEYGTTSPVQSA
jgi:hypothetical protein